MQFWRSRWSIRSWRRTPAFEHVILEQSFEYAVLESAFEYATATFEDTILDFPFVLEYAIRMVNNHAAVFYYAILETYDHAPVFWYAMLNRLFAFELASLESSIKYVVLETPYASSSVHAFPGCIGCTRGRCSTSRTAVIPVA